MPLFVAESMSEERDNTLAIAEMRAGKAAVRAEMGAMEARIDASLARLAEDMAKRDTRLLLVIVGTIVAVGGLATAVLGVIITAA